MTTNPQPYLDWLANLKEGDTVSISATGGYNKTASILTIERFTPTQIVMTNNTRADRRTGRVMGFQYRYIEPVTQKILDHNEISKLASWLTLLGYDVGRGVVPSLAQLRAMKAAFDEHAVVK